MALETYKVDAVQALNKLELGYILELCYMHAACLEALVHLK